MSIVRALALLGAGASGYVKGLQGYEDRQRQTEEADHTRWQRQREKDKAAREDKLFEQQQADRDAERAAMAPTKADDAPVAPPIGSRDEPRAPEDQGIRAAGKTFTNRADAEAAAADYNAAPSRMRRAASAVSDPVRAGQLEASAQTAETGAMQLREAKLKEADDAYNRQLIASVTDFGSLEQFVNSTKGDGQGGALRIKIQPSADGKTVQVMKLGPDGAATPTPFSFPNTTEGVQQAVGIIGMRLSPTEKLAHMQATAKTEEDSRRWELDFILKKTDAEARRTHEQRMLHTAERAATAAERQAGAAEAKAAAQALPNGLTIADLKDGHKTIATTLNADYKTQIDNAADDKTAKAIKTTREQEIAAVQRIYTGAMGAGFALTPEQAIVAYRTGETATQTFKKRDGSGTVKVQGILYQGKFIPMADNPGAAPGQAEPSPAAASAPPPMPAAAPAAAPSATPAAVPSAGPMGRVTGDKALNAITEQHYAALQPMVEQLREARAQLAAVGKSGDVQAITSYTNRVNALQAEIRKKAQATLGNQADAFLATL